MRLVGPQNWPGRFGRRKISYLSTFRTPDLQVLIVFDIQITLLPGAGIAQSVKRLATGWKFRGSNPGGGEIFRTRPDRPWGPPSLLYNGYRLCFPGVQRPGHGIDHPSPSSADVKERVELYLYSPSGPSWPDLGWTSTFTTLLRLQVKERYSVLY